LTERKDIKETIKEVRQVKKQGKAEGVGKNFEGTVGTVSADSFTITLPDGKSYTIKVSADAKVVNKNFLKMNLSDIQSGDRVRFFGTIDQTALTGNASVVRDLSVPRKVSQ
jgi:lipopolysaccharide export system protein LptA